MNSFLQVQTSFDKQQMDVCNMRCITPNSFNFLTPNQINCISHCTKQFTRNRIYSNASIDSDEGNGIRPNSQRTIDFN